MKAINKQGGVYLIEALIAMLLMAIIVMGMAFVSSKVLKAKAQAKIHNEVVDKLRNELLSKNVCDADSIIINGNAVIRGSISVGGKTVDYNVDGCGETVIMTVNNTTVLAPKPVTLITQSSDFANIYVGINQTTIN